VDSCKEGQKGALAAVCTPTLKSASKKHQKLCTSVSEHRVWHSEGGKKETISNVYFLVLEKIFSQSLVPHLKAQASNWRVSGKFAKSSNPVPNILGAI